MLSQWKHPLAKPMLMPEPMPTPNDHPPIQDLVIEDIEKRRRIGIQTYGTPLQPFNGRRSLVDAYEEALDLAMYLRQAIYEAEHPQPPQPSATCGTCKGHGYVPDWSNFNPEFGEPRPKPCPTCSIAVAGVPADLVALFVQHAASVVFDETTPDDTPITALREQATARGLAAVIPLIEARALDRLRPSAVAATGAERP